jgi:hypothetical protein
MASLHCMRTCLLTTHSHTHPASIRPEVPPHLPTPALQYEKDENDTAAISAAKVMYEACLLESGRWPLPSTHTLACTHSHTRAHTLAREHTCTTSHSSAHKCVACVACSHAIPVSATLCHPFFWRMGPLHSYSHVSAGTARRPSPHPPKTHPPHPTPCRRLHA